MCCATAADPLKLFWWCWLFASRGNTSLFRLLGITLDLDVFMPTCMYYWEQHFSCASRATFCLHSRVSNEPYEGSVLRLGQNVRTSWCALLSYPKQPCFFFHQYSTMWYTVWTDRDTFGFCQGARSRNLADKLADMDVLQGHVREDNELSMYKFIYSVDVYIHIIYV